MSFFVGVDGGSTKTHIVLLDSAGSPLTSATCGPSNINSVGHLVARKTIIDGIQELFGKAKITKSQVLAVCLGLSGVDKEEDVAEVTTWMNEFFHSPNHENKTKIFVANDTVVGLASGTGGKLRGIVSISGTGTNTAGFDSKGVYKRVSGWGPLLGDAGSGYDVGAGVLKAYTWAVDGRGPPTKIVDYLNEHLNLKKPMDLITWTYATTSWERIASLSSIAIKGYLEGDSACRQIIEDTVKALTWSISVLYHQLDFSDGPPQIVFCGGQIEDPNGLIGTKLKESLEKALPGVIISFPTLKPAHAAALLAINLLQNPHPYFSQ